MRRVFVVLGLMCLAVSANAQSRVPGKPIAKPLPDWCAQGECITPTVEYIEPTLFHQAGVLFRVEGETWSFSMHNPKKKTRLRAAGASYVFCSKEMPAVVSPSEGKYLVDFLTLDDAGRYGHANAISIAQYFAVCHGRIFDSFNSGGAEFAQSLGYRAQDRVDQPIIDRPQDVLKFLPKSGQ
ncbi:hypothetical protein [Microvirga calopogonii]|uniref:hypothetical protein n=1 Tax=Microvirga calopogonii TaxID=2078013 RepID=UPI000E0D2D27|nr:hypothetical protein [Microvirga calopogonii]